MSADTMAALATLRNLDIVLSPRVAAANFSILDETDASEMFKQLESLGFVEEVEAELYRLKR